MGQRHSLDGSNPFSEGRCHRKGDVGVLILSKCISTVPERWRWRADTRLDLWRGLQDWGGAVDVHTALSFDLLFVTHWQFSNSVYSDSHGRPTLSSSLRPLRDERPQLSFSGG